MSPASALSDELAGLVGQAVGQSHAARNLAIKEITRRPASDQKRVLDVLVARMPQTENVAPGVRAIAEIAKATRSLAGDAAAGVERVRGRLEPGSVVDLAESGVPELAAIVERLAEDTTVEEDVREFQAEGHRHEVSGLPGQAHELLRAISTRR